MLKYLPIGLAIALMLSAGYVQGLWSERWGTFPELKTFSDQLSSIPKQIGEWQGTDAEATDEKILKIAGAEGELVRTYKNGNGEEVRVSMICARLQDIFYHTPDRCYPAAGFDMQGEPQREVIEFPDGKSAEFFTVSFLKSEPTGTHAERGYWSWSGDGTWTAPDNPKLAFAGQQRALYKLYVFANTPVAGKAKPNDRDFANDFIRVFIPAAEEALRPAFIKEGRIKAPEAAAPEAAPAG